MIYIAFTISVITLVKKSNIISNETKSDFDPSHSQLQTGTPEAYTHTFKEQNKNQCNGHSTCHEIKLTQNQPANWPALV